MTDIDIDKCIYQLTIEDLQNVAEEELGRELTEKEIKIVEKEVAENIPWYDVIATAISDLISE